MSPLFVLFDDFTRSDRYVGVVSHHKCMQPVDTRFRERVCTRSVTSELLESVSRIFLRFLVAGERDGFSDHSAFNLIVDVNLHSDTFRYEIIEIFDIHNKIVFLYVIYVYRFRKFSGIFQKLVYNPQQQVLNRNTMSTSERIIRAGEV